jgi:hypothetical protein
MLYRLKKAICPPLTLYIDNYFFKNTKQVQEEVDILLSYHFGEERFKRHDPRNIVREHFNSVKHPYEYTTDIWEEDEVHQNAKTYDEVIFNRCGQPKRRIIDEEEVREVARKEAKQEEVGRSSSISISIHLGSIKEEEETPIDKKRRDKEKVLKKKNETKKKQKFEADKEKSKVEAEAKDATEKEKELGEAPRVAVELAKKVAK